MQTDMNLLLLWVIAGVVGAAAFFLLKKRGGSSDAHLIALKPDAYQPFKLIHREHQSPNTVLFRFALPSDQHRVGLPIGKHLLLRFFDEESKPVSRPYTPVSSDEDRGYFDLLIKLYPQGRMSQRLQSMQIGETIDVRGPQGSLEYKGVGEFHINKKGALTVRRATSVGMIAGGSGITPMLQLLRHVCRNDCAHDLTHFHLLFANVTESDILLRSELESMRERRSRTQIHYSLDKPPEGWTGHTGFVTAELIKQRLPGPGPDTLILLCGPKPMVDAMERNLLTLGYTEEMYFKY